jgi:hypothetical protein
MTYRITVEINPQKEPEAGFTCYAPDTACVGGALHPQPRIR